MPAKTAKEAENQNCCLKCVIAIDRHCIFTRKTQDVNPECKEDSSPIMQLRVKLGVQNSCLGLKQFLVNFYHCGLE